MEIDNPVISVHGANDLFPEDLVCARHWSKTFTSSVLTAFHKVGKVIASV